jgi:hypothetical protein
VKLAAVEAEAEATRITAQRFWACVPWFEVSHEPCQTNTPVAGAPVTFLTGRIVPSVLVAVGSEYRKGRERGVEDS